MLIEDVFNLDMTENTFAGIKNKKSYKYTLISPNLEEFDFYGRPELKNFCAKNNLSPGSFKKNHESQNLSTNWQKCWLENKS